MNPPQVAQRLFAPIAPDYERWARLLSLGQDARWRRAMVDGLRLEPGASVLDLAAGTGSITRLLDAHRHRALPVDQSREMLSALRGGSLHPVVATAERLPFPAGLFDAVTFGYLLRYVDDVSAALTEIARVLRPGGTAGMVEFGRPQGMWRVAWFVYTRVILRLAGRLIGSGWHEAGRFLGGSIDRFADEWPSERLLVAWQQAGFEAVEARRLSLGGGLVMWGRRR